MKRWIMLCEGHPCRAFRTMLWQAFICPRDEWLRYYNDERVHQGRWCYGKTPKQMFVDTIP
jgi:hypothetical protein